MSQPMRSWEEPVVVVSPVAQLVLQVAVFQQHPANHAGLHQQLQGTEDGGPPQRGQLLPKVFGGEGFVLVGDGLRDRAPWRGGAVALFFQGFQQLFGQGVYPLAHQFLNETKYLLHPDFITALWRSQFDGRRS